MNIGTLAGEIPAKEFEKVRATVTAGLAKLVEEVKKYAPAMYAATASATHCSLRDLTIPIITIRRPKVAIISDNQISHPVRCFVDQFIMSSSNIRFAAIAPDIAPMSWASIKNPAVRVSISFSVLAHNVTIGLKWAPDVDPKTRIRQMRAPAVAKEFSSSWRPVSFGLKF
jgi:hypothetical protein